MNLSAERVKGQGVGQTPGERFWNERRMTRVLEGIS